MYSRVPNERRARAYAYLTAMLFPMSTLSFRVSTLINFHSFQFETSIFKYRFYKIFHSFRFVFFEVFLTEFFPSFWSQFLEFLRLANIFGTI